MINKGFIFKIAFRYFRAKKNEKFVSIISGFSLLGVTIGVASLIIVMSVMNGFHTELTKNIIGLNGDVVITPAHQKTIKNYQEIKTTLLQQSYIKHVTLSIQEQVLALGKTNNRGALIKAIDLDDLRVKNEILSNISFGKFDNFHGTNVVALGMELANSLGITVGDKIKLISSNAISTIFGTIPRSKEFEVIALFTSNMYDYDAITILMPIEAAQNFLSLDKQINLIEVNTESPNDSLKYATKMQDLLGEKVSVISWNVSNAPFLNALAIERVAMFTILSLIITVAAFNIISSLFMLVQDKTSDIAILKTIGASTYQIMLIFIYNGMIIGLLGTLFGIMLGVGFSYNIQTIKSFLEEMTNTKIFEAAIYFLYTLPSEVRVQDILLVTTLSIILCFLATIYPSYKAAKLNPVDALRYE